VHRSFLVGGEFVDGEVVDLSQEVGTLEAIGSGLRRAESMTYSFSSESAKTEERAA
jgi:hypothetical protein